MTARTIHGNSQFQKPTSLRWTWESPGGKYHNEIDHIIVNRRYCLTDVGAVPKCYTGSDHRLLRARSFFSLKGEKAAKYKKRSPEPTINWDLFTTLAGFWEDTVVDNIDEEYERLIQHLSDSAKKAEGLRTTKRRLSHETLELICQRGAARAAGNYQLTSELARRCREAIREDLKERRAAVLAEAAKEGRNIRNTSRDLAMMEWMPIDCHAPLIIIPFSSGVSSFTLSCGDRQRSLGILQVASVRTTEHTGRGDAMNSRRDYCGYLHSTSRYGNLP
ncbi:hypothetical protein Y032_0508g2707 [Ancylostoma ceylanicum]|uniref:Endonuclease/exonuclease/phosphatase domain-containing protein n=1 Tax=Ancylostoma ceylanicum TaxID=53326 RepID=A0A016WTQ1_9BILA|nr:hypothetical protein Y032_0508g2707 [Ancylostoma ceylanicum]